jgi:UDP-glucose:(heptosyl)LPS alpha-1,3-glucosyltransferase
LHIALVILHADPVRGGAERYTVDLAAGLRGRGHDVALIASSFAPGNLPHGAVHLPTSGATRVGRYAHFLNQLNQHLAANSYDIVHSMLPVRQCDVYHPHAGIAAEAIRSGHLKHQGWVMQVLARLANQMNPRRRRFAAVERALLTGPRPPVLLCLSEYVKRGLLPHYSLAPDRLATLFNATDLQRFDPAARPQARDEIRQRFAIAHDRIVALMIAQDFARKGLAEAIGALSRVNDDRLILLVVGKQDPAAYRKLAEQKGVASRVIFAGKTADPHAFYRAADLFVLPTRHDPCSLVVLEALAMGLPVISTVFNGGCEIMEEGRHGFVLADPGDIGALTEALRKLLDDETRRIMSAHCIELRPRLAYERHLDELLRIYEQTRAHPAGLAAK